ncbi:protein of unknown function [Nitrospina watsonii]|uniref:Uncharacterized protein n=1 Tax=Nitrospina watsonii TaxID=1323948 RepID=A0ABM9H9W6_9BACT|nr:protein of unknown function [Nitrospina watsonii]
MAFISKNEVEFFVAINYLQASLARGNRGYALEIGRIIDNPSQPSPCKGEGLFFLCFA